MLMTIFMLTLAGFPLTSGFVGKIVVFAPAIDAGYLWLVIVGLVSAVAGLFFYIRVVVAMYFQEPALVDAPGTATLGPQASDHQRIVLGVCVLVSVGMGLAPWPLLNIVEYAFPF